MKEISVSRVEEGQRLDRFLGKCLPNASGGFVHKMLRKKNIKLNGKKRPDPRRYSLGTGFRSFFQTKPMRSFLPDPLIPMGKGMKEEIAAGIN